jgi:hypothetical protein
VLAVPSALLGRPQLAASIVVGTLLGSINFALLARGVANAYLNTRATLGFPMATEALRAQALTRLQAEAK